MARKSLSAVDTAWLRMEDPTNLMMITGVMIFGAPLDMDRLKATIEHRLLQFDRFRQRVVRPALGAPYWQEDVDFELDYHLKRATLPSPGDQAALQDVASLLASTQLDLSRPLWQFHLVERYGEGSALICRLHHCIGDGLALVYVLLSLTDSEPDALLPVSEPAIRRKRSRGAGSLIRATGSAVKATCGITQALLREGKDVLLEPSRAGSAARLGVRGAAAAARLIGLWPDPRTAFKGPLGIPKRTAWSKPIPLGHVKAIGKGLEGTVNDVLLTAMTGALRRYLVERGKPVEGLNIRAVVPVNLRKPGTETELGNKFGLVFLPLPVGIADPEERLRELKRRMDKLKDSLEAPVAFGILNTIGMTPEAIQDIVVNIFGTKGTAVMTNVMGPKERIYLAGAPLEALMFWVPQSGHLGMGVSILSYADRVWMGVITDEGLVPDPEVIIDGLQAEFDELSALVQRAAPPPTFDELAARLGESIDAVDALLAKAAKPAAVTPEDDPDRCQAMTQAGRQCRNRALPDSDTCRVHQP